MLNRVEGGHTMPEDISQPVIRYHQEVVNARKLDILNELFTPDFINEATGFPPIIGVKAMREVVQSILDGFPDFTTGHFSVFYMTI
jgi:hypothetical protein